VGSGIVSEPIPGPEAASVGGLRDRMRRSWWTLSRSSLSLIGLGLVLVVVLFALVGPWLIPYDPETGNAIDRELAPSWSHWFGTDTFGFDILARTAAAARLDLFIAFVVTAISLAVGSSIGVISGYVGGRLDEILMRVVDTVLAFPAFILALGIAAGLGNSLQSVVIALSVAYTPFFVRVVRVETLARRNQDFVLAARCSGARPARIIGLHILPNVSTAALVQGTLTLGWAILDTAALSFIGIGVQPPTAEWGVMVSEGAKLIVTGEWWVSLFPGLLIAVTVLGFNLLGDGLRDILDPEAR
jgi:peptide/nickel transport system permease protein